MSEESAQRSQLRGVSKRTGVSFGGDTAAISCKAKANGGVIITIFRGSVPGSLTASSMASRVSRPSNGPLTFGFTAETLR